MLGAPAGPFQGAGLNCPAANPTWVVGQHDERAGWIRPQAGGLVRRMKPDLRVPFDANATDSEENGAGRGAYSTYSFRLVLAIELIDLRSISAQVATKITCLSARRRAYEHHRKDGQEEPNMGRGFHGSLRVD